MSAFIVVPTVCYRAGEKVSEGEWVELGPAVINIDNIWAVAKLRNDPIVEIESVSHRMIRTSLTIEQLVERIQTARQGVFRTNWDVQDTPA